MFGDEKNLKDSSINLGITLKDTFSPVSYTKTDKLITALYMVTDIIDKDEPLRNKLRTLGVEILSDITFPKGTLGDACGKISELMSFLGIASAVNIISEMNTNILRKEFAELDRSIKESLGRVETKNKEVNLAEFFSPHPNPLLVKEKWKINSKGHTSIGVQKGSTLMQALNGVKVSDKTNHLSDNNKNFNFLKKQRQDEIKQIIKDNNGNATIKDIKNKAIGSLLGCGEKTIQRELISMVKEGFLTKTGEKRWSRYFLV